MPTSRNSSGTTVPDFAEKADFSKVTPYCFLFCFCGQPGNELNSCIYSHWLSPLTLIVRLRVLLRNPFATKGQCLGLQGLVLRSLKFRGIEPLFTEAGFNTLGQQMARHRY